MLDSLLPASARRLVLFFAMLIAISALLARASIEHGHAGQQRMTEALARVQGLDASIRQGVMATRFNGLEQYDPLVASAQAIATEMDSVRALNPSAPQDSALGRTLGVLSALVSTRLQDLEQFKPRNAVLKNSLRIFPHAIAQFGDTLVARGFPDAWRVSADELLQLTLAEYVAPSASQHEAFEQVVARFEGLMRRMPADLRADAELLVRHSAHIGSAAMALQPLMVRLLDDRVSTAVAAARSAYFVTVARRAASAQRWRAALFAWGAALLMLIIWGATRLVALYRDLDRRVVERTLALSETAERLQVEMEDRARMEGELRQAQKLESVGRLAAGVAHEINTPVQFVGDSMGFVRESVASLSRVLCRYRRLGDRVLAGHSSADDAAALRELEDEMDLDYTLERLPGAIDRSLDGLERIATIVRSIKDFAHPDRAEMSAVDLNRAVRSTVTVAHSEFRDVADATLDLGELPPVVCHAGDINQVVLNLIVNASHAMSDTSRGDALPRMRGRLLVRTRCVGEEVTIEVSDSGPGIPPQIQGRIFDPFFTTKEVGRGTGQGLSIARAIVQEKHAGRLTFSTEIGVGTTFCITLPVSGHQATAA